MTERQTEPSAIARLIAIDEACACRSALVTDSWAMRSRESPVAAAMSSTGPSTVSSAVRPVRRTCSTSVGNASTPGAAWRDGSSRIAHRAEHSAQVRHDRSTGVLDRPKRRARLLRVAVPYGSRGRRLHDHDRDGVGDDVVELPGDPRPFLGDGLSRGRMRSLQRGRTLEQRFGVLLACEQRRAGEPRGKR